MKQIIFKKIFLTEIEYERYRQCVKDFKKRGYVYYVTDNCPGVGYDIIYSMHKLKKGFEFNETTMRHITDIDYLLECF